MQHTKFSWIVLECPDCGEQYSVFSDPEIPSEKRMLYSDGFFWDPIHWRTPRIIGCVTCESGFFPEKGKMIASIPIGEVTGKWTKLKRAEPPKAGNLALELRIRKKIEPENEKNIRIEFWYAVNHSDEGRQRFDTNERFRNFWLESLEKLEALLSAEKSEDRLLKAEVNRQLGRFEDCILLLASETDSRSLAISREAEKKNRTVFTL